MDTKVLTSSFFGSTGLTLLGLAALVGCSRSLEGAGCPCATGFTCCENTRTCEKSATDCTEPTSSSVPSFHAGGASTTGGGASLSSGGSSIPWPGTSIVGPSGLGGSGGNAASMSADPGGLVGDCEALGEAGVPAGSCAPPAALVATTDLSFVQLVWRAPSGPTPSEYVILRDGVDWATVPGTDTTFDDRSFKLPEIGAPMAVLATQGTLSGQVRMRWQPPAIPEETHSYSVVARHANADKTWRSASSSVVKGRAIPGSIIGYEFSRDNGATWNSAGTELEYADTSPSPSILEGNSRAVFDPTRGLTVLSLESAPAIVRSSASSYRVRARTTNGASAASDAVTGFARVGDVISYQWQRADSKYAFADLPDVTGALWVDRATPLDASPQYRLVMSTEGAKGTTAGVSTRTVSIRAISSGRLHNCILDSAGKVSCWGGDLSLNSVVPEGQYKAIAAGADHSCAIRKDDTVVCWGNNGDGQADAPQGAFQSISAGFSHSCGLLKNRKVLCWGDKGYPQSASPDGEFTAIDCGLNHNCGIRPDGSITCWGAHSRGEAPPSVAGKFVAVSAGELHSCAITAEGNVKCWGSNDFGESPTNAVVGPFREVSAGYGQSCGVLTNGKVRCWGKNEYGEAPTDPPSGVFRKLPPNDPVETLSCGLRRTCAVRSGGRVLCWGSNSYGAAPPLPPTETFQSGAAGDTHFCGIGVDDRVTCWGNTFLPVSSIPYAEAFKTIASGPYFTCGIRSRDEHVACWGGQNRFGEESAPEEPFVAIGVGAEHACGVRQDGTAKCWGGDRRLGSIEEVTDVPPFFFVAVNAGSLHSCGLGATGQISCWGYDGEGQAPRELPNGPYAMLSSRGAQNCAITRLGELKCWGSGPVIDTQPSGSFSFVSVGTDHACAVRLPDKRVICWGKNEQGQAPAAPTIDSFASVHAGGAYTCGLRLDGRALCWGLNDDGEAPQP